MSKKKVYIISHSHWDREWYMPYEQHHMRLVTLMDDLLEIIKTDPDFHSFHLDGQTIILDDYLEVRPHKKEEVQAAIDAGKLKIGPFYILQDDFLISSEANTRNMLIGLEESRKWGTPVKLGYFPDTFGNMGQAPQMMLEGGIEMAAFGRGVKPTGFNNVVINDEKYASQFSEMWWQGPDGSKIFGLLFANWYSNGNEIPVDKEEAKVFWERKLADAELYASTNHLLMMNGCDHQPLQKDVTQAIKVANELYDDYEFIHSSFEEYLEAVMTDLPDNLSTVEGELTSQETDGWYTLANTSSSRIYLKQKNTEVQRQLESIAEPLATMASQVSGHYPHDELRYAWKLLLQNHPHDSICGCSVDEVHREMMTRFDKALEVGRFVASEALETLTLAMNTEVFPEESRPFIAFNTSGNQKQTVFETEIEWERIPFSEMSPPAGYRELKAKDLPDFYVIDERGQQVAAEIVAHDTRFGYDLPKDGFRIPFMANYVTVRVHEAFDPLSWKGYALVAGKAKEISLTSMVTNDGYHLENEHVTLTIQEDGRLTLTDKITTQRFENLLTYENVGDVGNEYIFKQSPDKTVLYSHDYPAEVNVITDTPLLAEVMIRQTLPVPVGVEEEQLREEMKSVTEFRQRHATRTKETAPLTIETILRLERGKRQIQCEARFNNQMKNHRLRVLFPTMIETNEHVADSIYEVATRPNDVADTWTNPTNPQHQQTFVNVHNETHGLTIGNYGLNEYELLEQDTTIAVTILRATAELGDWGYFETPEAQCLGEQTAAFTIEPHGANDGFATYQEAHNFQIPISVTQTSRHAGSLPADKQFATIESPNYQLTSFKCQEHTLNIIMRGYNLSSDDEAPLTLDIPGHQAVRSTLIETVSDKALTSTLLPAEIHTTLWTSDNA